MNSNKKRASPLIFFYQLPIKVSLIKVVLPNNTVIIHYIK